MISQKTASDKKTTPAKALTVKSGVRAGAPPRTVRID